MATALPHSQLYQLTDDALYAEYVQALSTPLKTFLLHKGPGHCQRVDYLPRPVMAGLADKFITDPDLKAARIEVRVVTDRPAPLEPWEVSGSGAVKLREDATYDRIKVFCALFPTGTRLAEEDSLNIATFKTDDAVSFDAAACLDAHINARINLRQADEKQILRKVLDHPDIRKRPIRQRLRYVLAVIGQATQSSQLINWETAGAYLYELNLIPDFELADNTLPQQLARNDQCMTILTDGEKSLGQNIARLVDQAELADENRRRELLVYLADQPLIKPEAWLPPICHDPVIRNKIAFDAWQFAQPLTGLKIELKPLKDPKSGKIVSGLAEKNDALSSDGKKPIMIKWTVSPPDHEDLGRIRIDVIRKTLDQGEIEVIPTQFVASNRKSFQVPISENNLGDDEQCIALIRIQALNRNGLPFHAANDESEEFWIAQGQEIEETPSDRGQRIRHLDEIRFNAVYATGKQVEVRSRGWDPKHSNVYSLRLNHGRRGDLLIPPLLLELERKILSDPGNLGLFEADLTNKRLGKLEDFQEKTPSPAVSQMANAFFQARQTLFAAVSDLENGSGVIEIADLHTLSAETLAYTERYLELLRLLRDRLAQASSPSAVNTTLHDYADLLRIDTTLLRVGPAEKPYEVLLLAPTHPLRVLWLYEYQTLLRHWIAKMEGQKPNEIRARLDDDVLSKLTSLNIPSAIAWQQGKAFINTDNIGLFWSLYPNGELTDLRSAVNAALQGLGATAPGGAISTLTPRQMANKISRYLAHHPYVQTLKMNVINPGDGKLLLDAIKTLLEQNLYADLNFDLKFFSPSGTPHPLVGSAFDDFMDQKARDDWSFGLTLSETEDRLLSPNENPLFPKLIYGKYVLDDLLQDDPERFSAHLTLVIDFFSTSVSPRAQAGIRHSSAVHNLLAEYLTDYQAGKTTAAWSRMIVPGRCSDLVADGQTGRLYETQDLIGHEAASLFSWSAALPDYLVIQLELSDAHDKNHFRMLNQVHELSDWVFTIDRNFGIEYFDDPIQGPGAESGGYLIDYTPEFLDGVAHRLIISTYHQQEIENILRYGFFELLNIDIEKQGELIDTARIADVLRLLKSVSGRLALKLINNPIQSQEVIGLALTRLALEQQGRLQSRILVPVDSHIRLFYQDPKELENADLTLKRTDLLLFELYGRSLHITLIEVKNRAASSHSELIKLYEAIRSKNENTEKHFRLNFIRDGEGRLDAAIKNKELADILLFYFERACRYGLYCIPDKLLMARRAFLEGLEAVAAGACEVTFSHEGFIFNGGEFRSQKTLKIHGNTIYTFGRAGICELLGVALEEIEDTEGNGQSCKGSGDEANGDLLDALSAQHPEQLSTGETSPSQKASPVHEPLPGISGAGQEVTDLHPITRVYLGQNVVADQPAFWDPHTTTPKRLLNQHLLILGKSGSGKSETTKSLLYELDRQGIPSIIFDFQGEYATGEFAEIVQPQVFDVMEGLPINPFEVPLNPQTGKRRRPVEMMFRLADTLNAVFAGSGDIQLGKLREAIKECYIQCGFDMNQPAPDAQEPPTLEVLATVLDQWSHQGGQIKNLQVRLQPLFESGIFNQGRANFSFGDLFKKTTVILLTAGIKDLMLAASRFLLEKIYATMVMNGLSKTLQLMVCVDEAHKLCNDPKITELAKEARKYGLGLILSSQESRDFHPSIFANAGTQIVLALEDADASIIAKVYAQDKKDQATVKNLIVSQESGIALIRSTHFMPYSQIRIQSFEDRIN